jgi:putative peptidoglycan lipid II flippase
MVLTKFRGNKLALQVALVALLTIFGKAVGFGRDVLLSAIFGAAHETDAFFIANAVPGFFFAGVFSTIGLVFLPIYARAQGEGGEAVQRVLHTATIIYMSLSLAISLLTVLFADVIVSRVAASASPETHALATVLTRLLATGFVFSGWVGIQNALQQARKAFIWPVAVPPIIHSFAIIGLLLTFVTERNILLVTVFSIIGWMFVALLFMAMERPQAGLPGRVQFSKPVARELVVLSFPIFLGVSLDQINSLTDLFLGSGFGAGAVSHLTYASRLIQLLAGLFSLLISYFAFPYIVDSIAQNERTRTRSILVRGIALMVLLTVPLAMICWLRSDDLIVFVFKRGQFSIDDVAVTADALRCYAAGMLFMGMREIFNRVFLAQQKAKYVLGFGVLASMLNVLSSLVFMQYLGLKGIALGTAFGALVYVLLQLCLLARADRDFLSRQVLWFVGVAVLSGAVMALPLSVHWLAGLGLWEKFSIAFDFSVAILVYAVAALSLLLLMRRRSELRLW